MTNNVSHLSSSTRPRVSAATLLAFLSQNYTHDAYYWRGWAFCLLVTAN